METKHTKGPWRLQQKIIGDYVQRKIVGEDGPICEMINNKEKSFENGVLLAEAPNLLESLETLEFRLGQLLELGLVSVNKPEIERDMRIAREAIKKALNQ